MPDTAVIAAFRFGFGLPMVANTPQTTEEMLLSLGGPDRGRLIWPGPTPDEVLALYREAIAARRAAQGQLRKSPVRRAHNQILKAVLDQETGFLRRTLARAIDSPDPFRERLALFWHDHFTAIPRLRDQAATTASRGDHAIRPHLAGRFADMLRSAILHPAMLIGLDQVASTGPNSRTGRERGKGLNENLARELIELHTLGVGAHYSQKDVTQLAELLTGLDISGETGLSFDAARSEPGAETVLGTRYDGRGMKPILQVLDDLARRPETARHLSHKLAVHFLSDDPDPALVARMADAYLEQDTRLLPVYAELLRADAARSPRMSKARQPVEFMACALRALGLTGAEVMRMSRNPFLRMIREPMAVMGQPWEAPRGPDGWPEAPEAWISPQGLAARITWSMEVPGRLVNGGMPDARTVMDRALGPMAGPALQQAVGRAASPREGVGLVLAAPEFNRR